MVLPIRGPNLVDSFLGEFVTGLGEGLVPHGTDLILAAAAVGQSELSVLRHLVESGRADGVVVTRIAEIDERLAYLRERNFPFIAHGRLLDADFPYNWLDTDGAHAFGEAFDMLYNLSHRHFGLVVDDKEAVRREYAIHFAVDAFNGKVDSLLSKVKHDNYGKLRQAISSLGRSLMISASQTAAIPAGPRARQRAVVPSRDSTDSTNSITRGRLAGLRQKAYESAAGWYEGDNANA
jgi:DNA-binding LacI/PurR family transcriptional regulator